MDKDYFLNSGIPPPLQLDHTISTWNSFSAAQEFNCSSEQQPMDFLMNPNWDKPSENHFHHFDSALSSMVSSPAATNSPPSNDTFVLRELIGKLGTINASNEFRQPFQAMNPSTSTSCFTTPLNSPPNLSLPIMGQIVNTNIPNSRNSMPLSPVLPSLSADPGFAERAAKFSCFGSRSFNGRTAQLGCNNGELPYRSGSPLGKLPRVSSSPSLKQAGSPAENKNSGQSQVEIRPGSGLIPGFDKNVSRLSGSGANSNEESSVSEQVPSGETGAKPPGELNSRKRKAISRGRTIKDDAINQAPEGQKGAEAGDNGNSKRSKPAEGNDGGKKEEGIGNNGGDDSQKQEKANQKPPEPPKDYIHVRARRGQATDSHSLAERVRREKISERMKLLQDLVPGCNKVTGKALMLDEIINYVQALQRQVEFLSMKLASVNPRMDIEVDNLMSKDMFQANTSMAQTLYPLDSSAAAFYTHQQTPQLHGSNNGSSGSAGQCPVDPLDTALCRNLGLQLPALDGFPEGLQQFPALCEDDLQSLVQMGFTQNPHGETAFHSQGFPAPNQSAHMKVEL